MINPANNDFTIYILASNIAHGDLVVIKGYLRYGKVKAKSI